MNDKSEITHSRGFTLIETFVAITILLVSIVGPLTLATRSLFSALAARDQLVASYLAQDAVEYIRYKRDSNLLEGDSWLNKMSDCFAPLVCQVDSVKDKIKKCEDDGSCPNLTYNYEDGYYWYKTDEDKNRLTPFNRTVTLSQSARNPEEYVIDVTVTWKTGSFERTFTTRESIFDWYKLGN